MNPQPNRLNDLSIKRYEQIHQNQLIRLCEKALTSTANRQKFKTLRGLKSVTLKFALTSKGAGIIP